MTNEETTKANINQAMCLMLVAGEETEFVDGHVYARAMSLGVDYSCWLTARALALRAGLIEKVRTDEYRTTEQGRVICEQVKEHFNLTK